MGIIDTAAVGKRVGFNVWDGDNAPRNLSEWNGIVTRKIHPSGGPVEYVKKEMLTES